LTRISCCGFVDDEREIFSTFLLESFTSFFRIRDGGFSFYAGSLYLETKRHFPTHVLRKLEEIGLDADLEFPENFVIGRIAIASCGLRELNLMEIGCKLRK